MTTIGDAWRSHNPYMPVSRAVRIWRWWLCLIGEHAPIPRPWWGIGHWCPWCKEAL